MADILKSVAVIFQGEDKLSPTVAQVEKSLAGVGTEADGASGKVGALTNELDKTGGTSKSIDAATTALKALAASLIVKEFIDANVAAEQFRKTMVAATGDVNKAAAEFEYVRQVSNRLGIETRSTAESYAAFSAAVKGTSLEGDGARVIFEAFAGTMSTLGASSADVNGAFVQLAQGVSKGKFELEDLKSIAERVPGFFSNFSDALGVTTAELYEMISAGQVGGTEILIFANKLNQSLQDADFDGYTNSLARLRNAIDAAFIELGDSGAFDGLIKAIEVTTASIVGATATARLLGETLANIAFTVTSGDFAGFGERLDESLQKGADTTRAARDTMLGYKQATEDLGFSATEAGERILSGLGGGATAAERLEQATKEVDKQLKALGVDPKKLDVSAIADAFEALAKNPAVRGDQILAGLEASLKKVQDSDAIAAIAADVVTAFAQGKLTAEEFAKATDMVTAAQDKLAGVLPDSADATKQSTKATEDAAKAAREAEKAAKDYALEMEKIASNERIKLIEARVALNVAEVEAETERMKAALESLNVTIDSTGNLLGDLLGLRTQGNLDWGDIRALEQQIELENERRREALDMQKKLIEAQIANLEAQTRALDQGDALIQVDGTGLQPHLEGFMWEIFKSIQTRVNQDGLQMLLGL